MAYDRIVETALKMYLDSSNRKEARDTLSLARRASAFLSKAGRVFPIVGPAVVLHRGTLDLMLKRRRPNAVIGAWYTAAREARRMTLPYAELRLQGAILAQTNLSSALRDEAHQRVRELAREIAVEPALPPMPKPGGPLDGAVQIKGEMEQPNRL
jgi:hypothetical protein